MLSGRVQIAVDLTGIGMGKLLEFDQDQIPEPPVKERNVYALPFVPHAQLLLVFIEPSSVGILNRK